MKEWTKNEKERFYNMRTLDQLRDDKMVILQSMSDLQEILVHRFPFSNGEAEDPSKVQLTREQINKLHQIKKYANLINGKVDIILDAYGINHQYDIDDDAYGFDEGENEINDIIDDVTLNR